MRKLKSQSKETTSFLQRCFNLTLRDKVLSTLIHKIQHFQKEEKVEAIAVRGVSGLIMGSILSHILYLPLIVVRKDGDDTHSSYKVEGVIKQNYIIVDDQIRSGSTIMQIVDSLRKVTPCQRNYKERGKPQCVGIFLYNDNPIDLNEVKTLQDWFKDNRLKRNIPIFRTDEDMSDDYYI